MAETIQSMICGELENLLKAVEDGKFGKGNKFDRDKFEAEFDDEVLVLAYVYDDQLEEIHIER